jgi:small multidrug resistance pump
VTILFPHLLFDSVGTPRPNYPEIWQCVGMIVAVYGVGYIAAARNSRIHWPIVLVGFLGNIFGPIGFIDALGRGIFPTVSGRTIITNDVIWWIPFGLMLWDAYRSRQLGLTSRHGHISDTGDCG